MMKCFNEKCSIGDVFRRNFHNVYEQLFHRKIYQPRFSRGIETWSIRVAEPVAKRYSVKKVFFRWFTLLI